MRRRGRSSWAAVTLVEVLVVLAILGMMMSLLLPAVQASRERARQSQCAEHLHQIGLAAHMHEAALREFPYTSTNYTEGTPPASQLHPAISPHRHLLAYLDATVYRTIDFRDLSFNVPSRPPYSMSPANAPLLRTTIPIFLCPSDRAPAGGNNYRANLGPGPGLRPPDARAPPVSRDPGNGAGAFVHARAVTPGEFRNGLSNTAFFSEKLIGDADPSVLTPYRDRLNLSSEIGLASEAVEACSRAADPTIHDSYGGMTWLYGGWNHTWYNHILTPNAPMPDCSVWLDIYLGGGDGIYTARSFHPGGVNVLLADGATRLVNDAIDRAVWRAMSQRKSMQ